MVRRSMLGFVAFGAICLLAAPIAHATPKGTHPGIPDNTVTSPGDLMDMVMTRQLTLDGTPGSSSAGRVVVAQGAPPPPPPPAADPGGGDGQAPPHQPKLYPPSKALMIVGWIMLGVSYIVSAVIGGAMLDLNESGFGGDDYRKIGGSMFVPVAGPFIGMAWTESYLGRIGLAFMGALEVAGLVMGIIGTVSYVNGMRAYREALRKGGIPVTDNLILQAGLMPARDGAATRVGLVYTF